MTHAPRAERHKTMTNENPFGEVIYSYSRAQAIEDGVLVDLSNVDSIRQHWKHPFVCTSTVWAIIEEALTKEGQDLAGICHDISTMAKLALRGGREGDRAVRRTCPLFLTLLTVGNFSCNLVIGS